MSQNRIADLLNRLNRRAADATLGILRPRSPVLREFLRQQLNHPPGESGSFWADPVFEAVFGWQPGDCTMDDLAGTLLHPETVKVLDAPQAPLRGEPCEHRPCRGKKDFHHPECPDAPRFGRDRTPYRHQLEAWRILATPEPRSVLVTSGTGSGKTESFLIPILDDLIRQYAQRLADRQRPPLTGVQALFLYPLNALIENQRDRLSAWIAPFKGDLRFCLYNGATPENQPTHQQQATPWEVIDRKTLRQSPPPILITNATMLEYMLVRPEDRPILDRSQGMLRTIVLDEAHTYLGAKAAEIALLLRRVTLAFGVKPEEVRFIATSATLGGEDPEEKPKQLRRFWADLAGIAENQVEVVEGGRIEATLSQRQRQVAPGDEVAKTLLNDAGLRRVYKTLAQGGAATLTTLTQQRLELAAQPTPDERQETLALLDRVLTATVTGGPTPEPLLPLRMHLFQRTLAGVWACPNGQCPGHPGSQDWPFGHLTLEERALCPHCQTPLFRVALCDDCGEALLEAEEQIPTGRGAPTLKPRRDEEAEDEYRLLSEGEQEGEEVDAETDAEPSPPVRETTSKQLRWVATAGGERQHFDPQSHTLRHPQPGEVLLPLHLLSGSKPTCPHCRNRRRPPRTIRLGVPFYLNHAIPPLLADQASIKGKENRPFAGRRLITFSDSRQGTARASVALQRGVERDWLRSTIYHAVIEKRPPPQPPETLAHLERERAKFQRAIQAGMSEFRGNLTAIERDITNAQALDNTPGRLSYPDAIKTLRESADFHWILERWQEVTLGKLPNEHLPHVLLLDAFASRPTRAGAVNLETLGLVALAYPQLERAPLPDRAVPLGVTLEEWHSLLRILADHFIRSVTAIDVTGSGVVIDDILKRWLEFSQRSKSLIKPGEQRKDPNKQTPWPSSPRSRIVRLLAYTLKKDPTDPAIADLLGAAWSAMLVGSMSQGEQGFRLDLNRVALQELRQVYHCPFTGHLLPATFKGITPFLPETPITSHSYHAPAIAVPPFPWPYGRDTQGAKVPPAQVEQWLQDDPQVAALRREGIWREAHDRVVLGTDYFMVEEHSAQQEGATLRGFEQKFKQGRRNILSCSTTMEMGVDIGGIGAVAMHNVPPAPANFMQRAGRAGRRGEALTTTLTLCPADPHAVAVFHNPLWPFETPNPIPWVALESERIARRHLHALLLADFLRHHQVGHKLKAGGFFLPPMDEATPWVQRFCDELRQPPQDGPTLHEALATLLRATPLHGQDPQHLLDEAAQRLEQIGQRWENEDSALSDSIRQAGGRPTGGFKDQETPGARAAFRQRERLRGEYLLSELAQRGFLPGYGFPTGVVEFINEGAEEHDQRQRRQAQEEREDRPSLRHHGYPSRDLPVAIQEYAPGAEVVVDGRMYRSAGITLNWHRPASVAEVSTETQKLPWIWRCPHCGEAGEGSTYPRRCPNCGKNCEAQRYLQPAGFAVDIRDKIQSARGTPARLPSYAPWVALEDTPWIPLPDPNLGRMRATPQGTIIHRNKGQHGHGFALCLICGRMASEHGTAHETQNPLDFEVDDSGKASPRPHRPLRGGRENRQENETACAGEGFAIQRNLWLAAPIHTDLFELQWCDPQGAPLDDRDVAFTLGAALRLALARALGIGAEEIGVAVIPSRFADGAQGTSVVLYDTASDGGGFVTQIPERLPELLRAAREHLNCRDGCVTACPACLLDRQMRRHAEHLNRHQGIGFLTPELLNRLDLPPAAKLFGPATRMETRPLPDALRDRIRALHPTAITMFLGGDPDEWDVAQWPLWRDAMGWQGEGLKVTVAVDDKVWRQLDPEELRALALRLEAGNLGLALWQAPQKQTFLLAVLSREGHDSLHWGSLAPNAPTPGLDWGRWQGSMVLRGEGGAFAEGLQPLPIPPLERLVGWAELRIERELDGDLAGFGSRFWDRIQQTAPESGRQIQAWGAPAEIHYTDRYLRTPLMAAMLHHLLATVPGGTGNSHIVIHTAEDDSPSAGYSGNHPARNWPRDDDRREALIDVLRLLDPKAAVFLKRRRELPHARELRLAWPNEKTLRIRFDQGLGGWGTGRREEFDFAADSQTQSDSLTKAQWSINVENKVWLAYVELPSGT